MHQKTFPKHLLIFIQRINTYLSIVRAQVPRITLDQLFEQKDEVGKSVSEELEKVNPISIKISIVIIIQGYPMLKLYNIFCMKVMGEYGYNIEHTLIVDIILDPSVRRAMNEINAGNSIKYVAFFTICFHIVS